MNLLFLGDSSVIGGFYANSAPFRIAERLPKSCGRFCIWDDNTRSVDDSSVLPIGEFLRGKGVDVRDIEFGLYSELDDEDSSRSYPLYGLHGPSTSRTNRREEKYIEGFLFSWPLSQQAKLILAWLAIEERRNLDPRFVKLVFSDWPENQLEAVRTFLVPDERFDHIRIVSQETSDTEIGQLIEWLTGMSDYELLVEG
ncbi:hypothetical protein KJ652_06395 [Patescibacteria group bacterium]|nr:hypothetical protein [Patescibacteria group bacterium]